MPDNQAIIIGINQYQLLQPTRYGKNDAEVVASFLKTEASFDKIFLLTDDSPDIDHQPTHPYRSNILRFVRQISESSTMSQNDDLWFFFSGHGLREHGADYLIPLDGDPNDIKNTAILVQELLKLLKQCSEGNVVLILDACRNQAHKDGRGFGQETQTLIRDQGFISIFSCKPNEYSHEIEDIGHGAFTTVFLDALGLKGKCATVEKLNQYLKIWFSLRDQISSHIVPPVSNCCRLKEP